MKNGFFKVALIVSFLAGLAVSFLIGCDGSSETMDLFKAYANDPSKLSSTALIPPSPIVGNRGDWVKLLRVDTPYGEAVSVNLSLRSEYSLSGTLISSQSFGPYAVTNATNATPIVITLATVHGFTSGNINATVSGVLGNLAANGVWAVTVIDAFSFSLNGSVGSGAYTGLGSVAASSVLTAGGVPQIGGPLVARVRWGLGGTYQMLDLDVPPPRSFTPAFPVQNQPVDDIGDGVSLCISGSAFEVQVRNDANLSFLTNPGNPGAPISPGMVTPAKVLAFLSPGTGANVGPIRRTIYVAGPGVAANNLAAGTSVLSVIPAFARRVWFPRSPSATTPLSVTTANGNGQVLRTIAIPVNSEGPIDLFGDEQFLTILNQGAVACVALMAMYDVNPS